MSEGKCVAVVVVHGIADQQPGQTVRELARLLCHGSDGEPRFVQGELQEILVPVARLEPGRRSDIGALGEASVEPGAGLAESPAPATTSAAPATTASADTLASKETAAAIDPSRRKPGAPSGFYQAHQKADTVAAVAPAAADESRDLGTGLNDYLLGRLALSEQDALYATTRASLRCRANDLPVDLYEMYWADQSRLGTGGLKALVSLYQLLINLSTLAADVVDQVSLSMRGGGSWRLLQRLHAWIAWLMKAPAVLVQLSMLQLLLFGAAAIVPFEQQDDLLVAVSSVAAIVLATCAVVAWLQAAPAAARGLKALLLLLAAAGCAALAVFVVWDGRWQNLLYLGGAALVTGVVGAWLIEHYSRMTRGVRVVGHLVVVVTVLTLLLQAWLVEPFVTTMQEWLLTAALRTGEILFAAILLGWALFCVVEIVALVLGGWLGRDGDDKVKASMHTARLAVVLSSGMFSVLSLVLWSVFSYIAGHALDDLRYESIIFGTGTWSSAALFLDDRVRSLGSFFTPLIVASAGLGIVGLLILAPSLLAELSPKTNIDAKGPRADAAQRSEQLGRWLGGGLGLLHKGLRVLVPLGAVVGGLLYLAFVARQFAFSLGFGDSLILTLSGWLAYFQGEALVTAGKWLAGGALTIAALGARFTNTFGRLRVVIDAVLDVDNYFADPPGGQPPRARIFSRYTSLLAYLRSKGYTGIVIVSHSQGTVISAELLRYLHVQRRLCDFVGSIPVSLVTVGSPLRDLYANRFPLLYQWMGAGGGSFAAAGPAAADIGAREWVNACRSGDYVGRFLWGAAEAPGRFGIAALDASGKVVAQRAGDRTEFCLGAGGHTHYFSNDALALGVEIERLIAGNDA